MCRLSLAATVVAATAAPIEAAEVESTWNGGTGDWGVDSNWTNVPASGGYPDNGHAGVDTYDAIVNSGTVTLDLGITIERFTLTGGTLTGGSNLSAGLAEDDGSLHLPGPRSYEKTLDAARNMIAEDPKRVAQVVRKWISEDGRH